jgi:hypothetical protein
MEYEEDPMRKGMAIVAACLLTLAVAAPVAAGPNVGNTSGGFIGAEGDWYAFDESTGTETYGYLFARLEKGQKVPTVDFSNQSMWMPDCGGGEPPGDVTPYDTTGDYSYEYWYAWGEASSLSVPKSFATATSSATLDVYHETYDVCTGEWTSETLAGVTLTLDLMGTGPIEKMTDRYSFHVPGSYFSHGSIRQSTRPAEGAVTVGDMTFTVDPGMGIIGSVSWMDHYKG